MLLCPRNADGPWRRAARRILARAGLIAAILLAPAAARGDVVRLLDDDRAAMQTRVDLIQSAQSEINLAYFSIAEDDIGLTMLALLRDAARRGVAVRLLIDALNNHIPDDVAQHLAECGVQIREYHPVTCTRPLWLNRRLHDKVFVVDGDRAVIGSRNLDGRNFGLRCLNFIDRDVFVQGCGAQASDRHFRCLWNSHDVRPVKPACPLKKCLDLGGDCAPCKLRAAVDRLLAAGFITLAGESSPEPAQSETATVHFLGDDGGPKEEPGDISTKLLGLLECAEHSIVLESPYLVFSEHLKNALTRANDRGVEVVILTNSLASTDQPMVYAGYENQKRAMIARGVQFWEFAGPNHLHAKSILVDGYISVIGSYNFDPRSEHLNTETAIISCDLCLADALIDSMAAHFAAAWRIGPDGKPIGADARHPGASQFRVHKLRASRLVAPLIKRHL